MVNYKLLQPQEIEVWFILPAIRRELSIVMKELRLDQKTIAGILGISAAAVSNYFTAKRAKTIKFNQDIKDKISVAAKEIIKDPKKVIPEIQNLLNSTEIRRVVCDIHREHCSISPECEVCFIK